MEFKCRNMTAFGCGARDSAKELMLQEMVEGGTMEIEDLCKEQCCLDCTKSCGYRCGRSNILHKFERGKIYIFSCKAWERYQNDYWEQRNEKYYYYEYDWMKLAEGKRVEIVTEVSGRVKIEQQGYIRDYIRIRPYGCIEVEDQKETLRKQFNQEEMKSVKYEQLSFF